MDFYKGKNTPNQDDDDFEPVEQYQPATPIVPLQSEPPRPVTVAEYQRANTRQLNNPELGRSNWNQEYPRHQRPNHSVLGNLWHLLIWPLKLGCRGCGCLVLLGVIGGCALLSYVVIAKPPFLWEPFASVLNGDAPERVEVLAQQPELDYATATAQILQQTQQFTIGLNTLTITQPQFQTIVRNLFKQSNITNIYTVITQDQVEMLWNFAQDPDQQVWFVVRLMLENQNQLKVKHIGFNNVGLPPFINKALTDATLSSLNIQSGQNVDDVLSKLLGLPDNAKITSIHLKPELIEVQIQVTSGLDNLFN